MADNTARGRFVWYELVTPNSAGAHAFYSRVLGWKTEPWEQDPSYSMFAAPSGPLGGSVESHDGTPYWMPYVEVPDVDATMAQAKELGGAVATDPAALPNGGRYASLTDPQGGMFGIYSSSGDPEPDTDPGHGEFSWRELATTGNEAGFAFYSELFGWEKISETDMGPMGTYLIFGRNGRQLGGMFDQGEQGRPGPAYWLNYVRVEDVDATARKVEAERGSLVAGPMEVPGGDWIAQFMDPYGAFFAVHVLAAEAKAARKQGAEEKAPRKRAQGKKAQGKKAGGKKGSRTAVAVADEGRGTAKRKAVGKKSSKKQASKKKAATKKAATKKASTKKAATKKAAGRNAAGKKAKKKPASKKAATKKATKKAGAKKTAKKAGAKKAKTRKSPTKRAGAKKPQTKKSKGKKAAGKKPATRKAGTKSAAAKKRPAAAKKKGSKVGKRKSARRR